MDFNRQLDELMQHASAAKAAAQAATTESRDKIKQRIDQTQVDMNLASKDVKQDVSDAATKTRSKWAKMKADSAAHMNEVKMRIDKRANQVDASLAAADAEWAEDDAANAISYAEWVVDNARLAVLDAMDARAYADELARTTK